MVPMVTFSGIRSITLGDVRVSALTSTLVRVEPKGPTGFEDRKTFSIAGREFPGVPLHQVDNMTVESDTFVVRLRDVPPLPTCTTPFDKTDVTAAARSSKFKDGAHTATVGACCALCDTDTTCTSWVYEAGASGTNCWPLASFGALTTGVGDRQFGCASHAACPLSAVSFTVESKDGTKLYDSTSQTVVASNLLHWPSPLSTPAYALVDFPRFTVPPWGPGPIPANATVEPALLPTHGYDFRNNLRGDTYVFLLGSDLPGWSAARADALALTGPCPRLPDFAFGTWFTWWHSYSESEAKDDLSHWESLKLPIDVWALDMNWRNTSHEQDHYYNHPNTALFSDFDEWFAFLKGKKLRTYFNDHPFPVASRDAGGLQTSPEETAFRWNGLSEWMKRGLTYWWFDHNWGFSIPPPFVNTSHTSGVWDGLDNAAWGSHIYYASVAAYDKVRDAAGDTFYGGRPMSLTKFGLPDARPTTTPDQWAESPAQHRFPVWWTGDGVNLQASVHTMVDSGVHDLKPYVHSDCGGDYRGSAGDLLRWTAHCTYGTIFRYHGNDHRPWTYDDHTTATIKSYLQTRYALLPSLIAAGDAAASGGFPLVARADLFWPTYKESTSRDQYIFLNDTLVAPIWDSKTNLTTRDVWFPPGEWHDAWNGTVVTGPTTRAVALPYERVPLYHRAGGLVVVADDPEATRVEEQDWSTLLLAAFPHAATGENKAALTTTRWVVERSRDDAPGRTKIEMSTEAAGKRIRLAVSGAGARDTPRAWHVRVHLRHGQRALGALVDGAPVSFTHLLPTAIEGGMTTPRPFGGRGSPPPMNAGPIVEIVVEKAGRARAIELHLE